MAIIELIDKSRIKYCYVQENCDVYCQAVDKL